MRPLPLLAAAALALAAGACAAPSAETSAADGAVSRNAEKARAAGQPWWRLSRYSRKPGVLTPKEMQERRPGLFSGRDGEFVLYRKGEAVSSDPTKPTKVRR